MHYLLESPVDYSMLQALINEGMLAMCEQPWKRELELTTHFRSQTMMSFGVCLQSTEVREIGWCHSVKTLLHHQTQFECDMV